jgi:nucleoside-diphosphate-sugar epimerase
MHPGKNKILITGANGFLGYELFKFLAKKNKVIGTSKKKSKYFIKLNYPRDVINKKCLNNVETVIHLASLDRDQVKKNIDLSKKINVQFTEDLIDKCIEKKVKNFIYFSSIGVYGNNLKNKINEDKKPKPTDTYSKLKYETEKKILNKKNIRVVILRVSNIVGAPSKISKGFIKLFLPDICISALKNSKILLKSDGNQYRDFLDLKVLLKIIKKLLVVINKLKVKNQMKKNIKLIIKN